MGNGFRISLSRMSAAAFSVFILTLGYACYHDYCVVVPLYTGTAKVQIEQPVDPESPAPLRSEIEFMSSPDVLSPIVTDLQLDKVWARRFRSALDALPMQDSLAYLHLRTLIESVPGTRIVDISVSSDVPNEASQIANAIANRYETERERESDQLFREKVRILDGQIAQQTQVVAQKADAAAQIRAQLQHVGTSIAPGAAGLIEADLAAQKSGVQAQVDALAPLRAAQAQLDAQKAALDDLQLHLRQLKNANQLAEAPVRIVSLADPPEYASTPNHEFDLMLGAVAGLVFGIMGAALLELVLWYFARISPPADRSDIPVSTASASAQY